MSPQRVTAALYVDLGENKHGTWIRPPRARYECLRCRTVEGPVEGPVPVTAFTEHVADVHRTRCTAVQENSK